MSSMYEYYDALALVGATLDVAPPTPRGLTLFELLQEAGRLASEPPPGLDYSHDAEPLLRVPQLRSSPANMTYDTGTSSTATYSYDALGRTVFNPAPVSPPDDVERVNLSMVYDGSLYHPDYDHGSQSLYAAEDDGADEPLIVFSQRLNSD